MLVLMIFCVKRLGKITKIVQLTDVYSNSVENTHHRTFPRTRHRTEHGEEWSRRREPDSMWRLWAWNKTPGSSALEVVIGETSKKIISARWLVRIPIVWCMSFVAPSAASVGSVDCVQKPMGAHDHGRRTIQKLNNKK